MEIKNEAVLILDFGGQYSQLIARRVRELNVYCEIKPYRISAEEIKQGNYKGIIFSGGPNSVYAENIHGVRFAKLFGSESSEIYLDKDGVKKIDGSITKDSYIRSREKITRILYRK